MQGYFCHYSNGVIGSSPWAKDPGPILGGKLVNNSISVCVSVSRRKFDRCLPTAFLYTEQRTPKITEPFQFRSR